MKRAVIFGESNITNTIFHNAIRRSLMINKDRLDFSRNNYLETAFDIGENQYTLFSTSSILFPHKNDNEISKAEGILNQQLLLSSDVIYLLISIDNADLDYNLSVQKYFNQNKKKHLVVFNSSYSSRDEFEDHFLNSIPTQRIIKNSSGSYFFFSLKNNHIPQLQQFTDSEFPLGKALDRAIIPSHQQMIPKLTIFGPPNSGKSTLLNTLLGRERSIVSPLAGTTRENVLSLFGWKGITLEIKDTEGISTNKRNDYSILGDCQISWVILDSTEPLTKKVLQIINLAEKCNRALVIILNKVDIATAQQINARKEEINSRLKSFSFVPVVFISAQKKSNLSRLLTILEHLLSQSRLTFSKTLLTQQFSKLLEVNPPAAINGKYLKVYYAFHEKGFVHKFIVFVNNPALVHFSYHRYIVNYLRKNLKIDLLPLRLFFKKS